MHKLRLSFLLLASVFILFSCGNNQSLTPPVIDGNPLEFGTDLTLDILTWNLKEFPYHEETIMNLAEIIPVLKADVIAFQEIMDPSPFYALANQLPGYQALVYNASSSWRLAYLYNSSTVSVNDSYTIFNDDGNAFPRPPYILDMNFGTNRYYVINNHFKALGDNVIDETDPWDEEMRRLNASLRLEEYIRENLPDQRVIMLGDLNDQLQESEETNVFLPFLNRGDDYFFTTMPIAQNPTLDTVSYPARNSILDHILITDELFGDFDASGAVCKALKIEDMVGGLSAYYDLLSDHRPVGIRLLAY